MKRKIIILLIFAGCFTRAVAQDFAFGKITDEEMDMKNYPKDTAAHAVVLREFGSSRIDVTGDDEVRLVFNYHVKIKIFDSKGFDAATVAVKIENDNTGNFSDELKNVSGTTFYKDNGIREAQLDPTKLYTSRDYKYQSTTKFTMPGLVSGCVVEYKYTLVTPFFHSHFHPWEFQSDIPKVYSEYTVFIPGLYTYNASLRGPLKLTKTKDDIEQTCFSLNGIGSDCSHLTYIMTDVPAFVPEDYMTSPKNFISAINYDLVEYFNVYTGHKEKVTTEWKDVDAELKANQYFGEQLKKQDVLKDRIVPVIIGKPDDLSKAKAIYVYIQKSFKWNDYIGIYTENSIRKALDAHSGGIADINISLIAALNSAGIKTEAVLLSTRNNGTVNDLYPASNGFNYVIAKATIGTYTYLLDATDPLLPFGTLPLKCLNDKGRVFSFDKPSYWMDLNNIQQKEKTSNTLDFTLQDNGKLKGTYTRYSFGYAAYEKRVEIKKFNSTDEYVEKFASETPRLKVTKSEITNLDSLEAPLIEKYDVEYTAFDKMNNNLTFNPFFWDKKNVNPFKSDSRTYPVDMGVTSDDRLVLTVHLPDAYKIETPPQTVAIGMPGNGGKFITDYQPDNNSFTFSSIIQFNKPVYELNEYPYLKELYNKIILSEKAEMVFKKK